MLLPPFLLLFAAFMLLVNLKVRSTPSKAASYILLWTAALAAIVVAVAVYQ